MQNAMRVAEPQPSQQLLHQGLAHHGGQHATNLDGGRVGLPARGFHVFLEILVVSHERDNNLLAILKHQSKFAFAVEHI